MENDTEGMEEATEVTESLVVDPVPESSSSFSPEVDPKFIYVFREFGKAVECFDFSKACQIIREFRKTHPPVSKTPANLVWDNLLSSLADVAECDEKYYSLSFLQPRSRSVFRKDAGGLDNAYKAIQHKLDSSTKVAVENPGISGVIPHLLSQCRQYATSRMAMMKFYEEICTTDPATVKIESWYDMEGRANRIFVEFESTCIHPYFENTFNMFKEEVTILRLLISAQLYIADCKMFESLLQLKAVRERFEFWMKGLTSLKNNSTKVHLFFKSRSEPLPRNRVIHWLIQFYNLLMAKFSLYFTNSLGDFCSTEDLQKIHSIDNSYNFINEFREILKKTGALLVGIVMDRSGDDTPFYGFGYHRLENRFTVKAEQKPICGLNAKFPYVFKETPPQAKEDNRASQPIPSEIYHDDISIFIQCFRNRERLPPSLRDDLLAVDKGLALDCDKAGLLRWFNPYDNRCVVGDFLERNLYIIAVYPKNEPSSSTLSLYTDNRPEILAFIRKMQHLLRSCALLADLKACSK